MHLNNLDNIVTGNYMVVGSVALNTRISKDLDIICYYDNILIPHKGNREDFCISTEYEGKRIEFLIADNDVSLDSLLKLYKAGKLDLYDVLYVLKAGHIHVTDHRQQNWEKHIHDLHILSKIVKTFRLEEHVKLQRKETNRRVKQYTPKLKGVSKEEFFDDFVLKFVDHDEIHKVMAHRDKPMYEYMKIDDTVECHKELWDKFTFEQQIQCVLEEAYVIAIERKILPALMRDDKCIVSFIDFKWALFRICTTLCSGWFRQFAIDNYYTILNSYDKNFMEKFKNSELFKGLKQPA